jgi:hypothetical protein
LESDRCDSLNDYRQALDFWTKARFEQWDLDAPSPDAGRGDEAKGGG